MIFNILVSFIIILLFVTSLGILLLLPKSCNNSSKENYENISLNSESESKPILWVYWENKPLSIIPPYIKLCIQSIFKHCSKSFHVVLLNEKNIYKYLPELKQKEIDLNFSNLLIAQKVDYYRILLLTKYGGLYLDADVLVLKDPIEIIEKLKEYDFVGFGCTGLKCNYGYGRPSNGILASRPQSRLMVNVLKNIEDKINKINNNSDKKFEYFDLGKYVIWDELDKLFKNENYKYFHFSNDYDGTRDINGRWINLPIIFSEEPIPYKNPDKMFFLVLYNSGMDEFKKMSEDSLLKSNMNISKFLRKSLLE